MMEAHVPISLHTEAEIESDAQFPDFGHFVRKRKYSYFPQYVHNFLSKYHKHHFWNSYHGGKIFSWWKVLVAEIRTSPARLHGL